jgi:uncharacterized protein
LPDTNIADLVGYGATANCYEGTGYAPSISSTLSNFRGSNGCDDTDNNNSDFSALPPAPRNSASAQNVCP